MLEAVPKGFLGNDYVIRADGRELVVLDLAALRERGEFELEHVRFKLYRQGAFSGDFILERGGVPIARARKPSVLKERFELEIGGRRFTVKKPSIFSREFTVSANEKDIGSIRPASFFSRKAVIDLPGDWPLPVQLFAFWLVLILWKRQQAAAASG